MIADGSRFGHDCRVTERREHEPECHLENGVIAGKEIMRLMRQYRVTIRELSHRTGITMKRIREVRDAGLNDRLAIRDWIEAITGRDPGPLG